MSARHAVLLTPSKSSAPPQLLSCKHPAHESLQIPFFVFKRLRTLSFSVSSKSCACHSYENCRGVAQLFPYWNSKSSARCLNLYPPSSNPFPFTLLRTLFVLSHATARSKPCVFSCLRTLCRHNGGSIGISNQIP